jgi:hypothetical protein
MDSESLHLGQLTNGNQNQRYAACEELRVASAISQEAMNALEEASYDPDPLIADAAKRALATQEQKPAPLAQGAVAGSQPQVIQSASISPSQPLTFRDAMDPIRLYNPTRPAGRLLFLWGWLVHSTILLVTWLILVSLINSDEETQKVLGYLGLIGYVVAEVFMVLRRLRDLGKSGLTILLGLIPIVNSIFVLYLIFTPGVARSAEAERRDP